jgi:valyl-tRNA synthetase
VQALEEKGLLVKVDKNYRNRTAHCYKCDTVIEPMIMQQWFIDIQPLAKPAIQALRAGEIDFYPEAKKQQLLTYLENLKDWNISRQIAWGIPIPAFQNVDDTDDWIYDERVDQEILEIDGKTYRRDPDVFDTWFSSSSWPYATLDYPDGKDFKQFYPLSLMETGFDILYPWVSRMLMFGLYVTGEVPFKTVYLHGLILDEHGQKMSKSKGNVINPMEIVDQYGSDALRMGLITGQTPGNNQPFGMPKIIGARNFCNKLWNIARYTEDKMGGKVTAKPEAQTDVDHWLLDSLSKASTEIAAHLDSYRFAEAFDTLYHFVWDDFADWYIEASKAQPNLPLLAYGLEAVLKMAHPFAPFLTETIWQTLGNAKEPLLATSSWPEIPAADKKQAKAFGEIKQIVTEVRAIMQAVGVKTTVMYFTNAPIIKNNRGLIASLAHLTDIAEDDMIPGIKLTATKYDIRLNISQEDAESYAQKLASQKTDLQGAIERLQARLGNKQYVDHAPANIVAETRQQLAETEAQLAATDQELKRFK